METNNEIKSGKPRVSRMAISSLVLGLASFVLWIIAAIPAVVLGILALLRISRSKGELRGTGFAIAGMVLSGCGFMFVSLALLMLPAIHAARNAAQHHVSMNNMKQIMLAMHSHHDTHHALPAPGNKSQLSWRVHLLPYLGYESLYQQFRLDEPWDSEHNRKLIAHMPEVYIDPSNQLEPGKTAYLLVTGPNTAFPREDSAPSLHDIADGISATLILVESDPVQAVIWTQPSDWQFDAKQPTRGLGSMRHSRFLAATADGAVGAVPTEVDANQISAVMTSHGGEEIAVPWF